MCRQQPKLVPAISNRVPRRERGGRPPLRPPPTRPVERTHKVLSLFVEDENAGLAGKAHFFQLAVFPDEHGIRRGLRGAIFPTAFAFRDSLAALLNGGLVAVDRQAILTCLQ